MTSPMAELSTAQCKKEYNDTGDHSTRDCCSEKICYVHPDSAGTPVWKGPSSEISLPVLIPHPHQYTLQPEILDPLSLRFHCPYQSTQCLLTYPYDLQQPQSSQYHLLAGSHHYPVSGSWFTNEPICCSMMQGDLHNSVAMDYQQFQEGLPEDTPYIKQPVMCSVSGDGQVGLVDPFESGPVEKHRDDGLTQVKDCGVLGSPCQTPCPLYESIVQASNMQPQTPPARTFATVCESKSRKPCHCTRSQCLKLYCECFANGAMCINCDCSNCHNNSEHQMKRHKAIKSCLGRNPDAFRPKIAGGKSGVVKGRHNKGCNCKRSGCLKNYCECYEANIMCTSSCKCVGCRNYDKGSQTSLKWKTDNVEDRRPEFVITSSVVEAVCGCLLAQAEREAQSPAQAEQSILEEFGHCLSQIVKTVFE